MSEVDIYTDGSLSSTHIRIPPQSSFDPSLAIDTQQGAAFFIPALDCHVSTNLSLWPSSTRTELVAIFLALLACAHHTHVSIFTDSAAAIAVLSRDPRSLTSTKWNKTANRLLVMKILTAIHQKQLTVTYNKVKGHSGNVHNDHVDMLAESAGENLDSHFNNNFSCSSSFVRYFPIYDNLAPIEAPFRKFLKAILSTYNATEWSLLSAVRSHIDTSDINWNTSWDIFKQLRGFKCDTQKKASWWTFAAKMFMKLLPLASQLKLRRPHLYQNLYCPACSDCHVESVSHLLSCSAYTLLWEQLFFTLGSNLRAHLLKTFVNHSNRNAHVDIVLRAILGNSARSDSFLDIKTYGIEMKI